MGRELCSQLGHGEPERRMAQRRRELAERIEDEGALVEAWMREHEVVGVDHGVADHEQVEIEGAWAEAELTSPLAAVAGFDPEQE